MRMLVVPALYDVLHHHRRQIDAGVVMAKATVAATGWLTVGCTRPDYGGAGGNPCFPSVALSLQMTA